MNILWTIWRHHWWYAYMVDDMNTMLTIWIQCCSHGSHQASQSSLGMVAHCYFSCIWDKIPWCQQLKEGFVWAYVQGSRPSWWGSHGNRTLRQNHHTAYPARKQRGMNVDALFPLSFICSPRPQPKKCCYLRSNCSCFTNNSNIPLSQRCPKANPPQTAPPRCSWRFLPMWFCQGDI